MRRTGADYDPGFSLGAGRDIARALREQLSWLSRVLDQAVETHVPARRSELSYAIRHHWRSHAAAQERCVFWLLQAHVDAKQSVKAGRRRHAKIGQLVEELFEQDTRSEAWRETARGLAAALEELALAEERDLLPRLALLLDRRESAALASLYEQCCALGPERSATTLAAN